MLKCNTASNLINKSNINCNDHFNAEIYKNVIATKIVKRVLVRKWSHHTAIRMAQQRISHKRTEYIVSLDCYFCTYILACIKNTHYLLLFTKCIHKNDKAFFNHDFALLSIHIEK